MVFNRLHSLSPAPRTGTSARKLDFLHGKQFIQEEVPAIDQALFGQGDGSGNATSLPGFTSSLSR